MPYQQITDYCFKQTPTAPGIDRAQTDVLLTRLEGQLQKLKSRQNAQANPLLDILERTHDLDQIEHVANDIRKRFSHVVILGTGGSGMSGRTLTALKPRHDQPKIHFLENIDPDIIETLLNDLPIKDTCFIVISKSGTTAETLSEYYCILHYVSEALGKEAIKDHFIAITMATDSPLRQSAIKHGFGIIEHEAEIGGRFSIFTSVGLLPAALVGMNIRQLREGAASVVSQLDKAHSAKDCEPAVGAAIQTAFIEANINISIMMPYAERLVAFSGWYRQNWAESLGKTGKCSTPVRAVGCTDQHSQLQLYLDGPKDKSFNLILLNRAGDGRHINAPADPQLDYLQNKTLGDIMAATQKATKESLINHQCPVRIFTLTELNEYNMGALLMHFMLEIILTAELLGVNAFDQPAVEEGKILARNYLLEGALT